MALPPGGGFSLVSGVKSRMVGQSRFAMSQAFELAGEAIEDDANRLIRAIGRAVSADAITPQARKTAHQRIAQGAARSMAAASAQGKRPAGRYRGGGDRLSGRLAPALRRSWDADADSIRIIDTRQLAKEAKHYRRLNFGAGGGGQEGDLSPPDAYSLRVTGTRAFNMIIGLAPDPRPAFRLPRGVWISGGGERVPASQSSVGADRFFPASELPNGVTGRLPKGRGTRGIAARNFLDAGVRRIARETLPAYEGLYRDVFYSKQGPSLKKRIGVTVAPRPGPIGFRVYRS